MTVVDVIMVIIMIFAFFIVGWFFGYGWGRVGRYRETVVDAEIRGHYDFVRKVNESVKRNGYETEVFYLKPPAWEPWQEEGLTEPERISIAYVSTPKNRGREHHYEEVMRTIRADHRTRKMLGTG